MQFFFVHALGSTIAGLCFALVVACSSPAHESSREISEMYAELRRDDALDIRDSKGERELAERQASRIARVHEIVAANDLESARDHLEAAAILVASDETGDLELAERLAREAARRGEDLGFRVLAEAIDKQLVKRGQLQRYGTQYAYEPAIGRWRLYPIDLRTTDAERKAMGVPPLAEIQAREKRLNEPGAKP